MYNSIKYFEEECIKRFEKLVKLLKTGEISIEICVWR